MVAAAAPAIPPSLLAQLRVGGRMALPVGKRDEQELLLVLKTGEGVSINALGRCRFVRCWARRGSRSDEASQPAGRRDYQARSAGLRLVVLGNLAVKEQRIVPVAATQVPLYFPSPRTWLTE